MMHVANTSVHFKPFETIFAQGDSCTGVLYIQEGRVRLTATSHQGRRRFRIWSGCRVARFEWARTSTIRRNGPSTASPSMGSGWIGCP